MVDGVNVGLSNCVSILRASQPMSHGWDRGSSRESALRSTLLTCLGRCFFSLVFGGVERHEQV